VRSLGSRRRMVHRNHRIRRQRAWSSPRPTVRQLCRSTSGPLRMQARKCAGAGRDHCGGEPHRAGPTASRARAMPDGLAQMGHARVDLIRQGLVGGGNRFAPARLRSGVSRAATIPIPAGRARTTADPRPAGAARSTASSRRRRLPSGPDGPRARRPDRHAAHPSRPAIAAAGRARRHAFVRRSSHRARDASARRRGGRRTAIRRRSAPSHKWRDR